MWYKGGKVLRGFKYVKEWKEIGVGEEESRMMGKGRGTENRIRSGCG